MAKILWNAEKKQRVANEILYSAITLDKAIELCREENAYDLADELEAAKSKFVRDLIEISKTHHLGKIQVPKVVA